MAPPSQRSAPARTTGTSAPRTGRPSPDLEVARKPDRARRSIGGIGTVLASGLFAVCLALAALHAVLVENQATLDDLLERNEQRYERIDNLQAEIAYLDSPEGLADQAHSAGLVPSAELAVLTPIGADLLPPPGEDPFDLESSGWPPDPPAAEPPEAPEPGLAAG
ncbi:MAG: hypothetical protein F4110_06510 [Acidimicrobiaceae bacterium]|nr:hypothetical protein [Acidimicrobiaceae bacterium]MYE96400.1 hypothetical protein [Acidimicrobiaceae bacterium]MYH42350.1 hypothetical protein [Acidimicrobiaceae bacterium]MYI53617.1 hypothetical protein [Acidimicrobiaceae bacterium]MYJ80673.1 hypothetical protein [Acidimicrobiaceae bacterium]